MKKLSFIIILLIFAVLNGAFWTSTFASEAQWAARGGENERAAVTAFLVTKIEDSNDGSCDADCSLREAVNAANAAPTNDVISFDPAAFPASALRVISLTSAMPVEISNNGTLTIDGTEASSLSVNGNNATRIFRINFGATVFINDMTIARGNSVNGQGGGIYNSGILVLNDVVVTENAANGVNNDGGGIYNDGASASLTLNNSDVNLNTGNGAGIYNFRGAVTINNSSVNRNTGGSAAGIYNYGGNLTLTNSQVNSNTAQSVGGIHNNLGGTVTAIGLTVNGNTSASSLVGAAGISNSDGTIDLTNSVISNNIASNGDGGGIYNSLGTLNLADVTISGNSACANGCRGGGIYSFGVPSVVTMTGVNVINNSAANGGGLFLLNSGTIHMSYSTVAGNTAGNPGAGAGISFFGNTTLNLFNTTVANNTLFGPSGAGGINIAGGTLNLNYTTVANNRGGSGGGICNGDGNPAGTVNSRNSIIADNTVSNSTAQDVFGALISQGNNLIENTAGATISGTTTGNILGQDAQLLPLRNNGGSTQTVALQPTSPAVDAGDLNNFPPSDQRGVARPQDGDLNGSQVPDIGAYERQVVIVSTVTKTADTSDGDCDADCSLREALEVANNATTPDNAIFFDASVFAAPQTITLTQGELRINNNRSAAIYGKGASLLTISGNNQSRVFSVSPGGLLWISGATITGGNGSGSTNSGLGGAFHASGNSSLTIVESIVNANNASNGGAIYSGENNLGGALNVLNSTISGNSATSNGGAAVTGREANFSNSIISGNTADANVGGIYVFGNSMRLHVSNSKVTGNNGGIYNAAGSITSINNSIVSNNFTRGGISNFGRLSIDGSTVSNNASQSFGGGIANYQTLALTNSTVSANWCTGFGGGIYNHLGANAAVTHSTIANNQTSSAGGGIFNGSTSIAYVGNTIIAGNRYADGASDFWGVLTSQGYNLIGNASGMTINGEGTGNILNQNPQLMPLGNYGGATPTHGLRLISPAIDKGKSFGATTDQRGRARPFDNPEIANAPGGDGADIGAFERQLIDFIPKTLFDYDGDERADISVFRPSAGSWYISQSSNNAFIAVQFGAAGDLIAPADYDGDGRTDVSVFRPSDGTWYRLNSSNNTFTALQFGASGDLPAPGDFDGDGKADLTVYRPSAGSWYRINSSNNQVLGVQFGIAEDKPIIGDFDGDGKSDLCVFRPSNGVWYRIDSGSGTFSPNQFGTAGDLPVAADYDGDGKTDLAVFRPSVGDWYWINSSNVTPVAIHFGVTEDKPAPADYDGDGKADLAVFRPLTGTWYLLRTSDGFTGFQFGASGDTPTPNAFVR